jgi:uncharacterized iron-regulated membrane protein
VDLEATRPTGRGNSAATTTAAEGSGGVRLSAARAIWLVLHRWAGLTLAVFLVMAGLTGAALAFYDDLHAATARWVRVEPPAAGAPLLDPIALHAAAERAAPEARFDRVELTIEPGRAVLFYPSPRGPDALDFDELALDPYTGAEVYRGTWADITEGWHQLMPFIFRLHYTFALGEAGRLALGIAALVWTLDCFISFLLTLPHTPQRWWHRWRQAWQVRGPSAGSMKFTFDLHRASGLWLWPVLLVFAWSSVGFNLTSVYDPVMSAFGATDPRDALPKRLAPDELEHDWAVRLDEGRALARQIGASQGFEVVAENGLSYRKNFDAYEYRFAASDDVSHDRPQSRLYFDRATGEVLALKRGLGRGDANGLHEWIVSLHIASVGGTWYRTFVVILGLAVAALSMTGFVLWLRKREASARRRTMRRPA